MAVCVKCFGHGQINCPSHTGEKCRMCGGSGKVTCTICGGKGTS